MKLTAPRARPRPMRRHGRPLAAHLVLLCALLLLPVLMLVALLLFRIATAERQRHEAVARDGARRIAISLDRGLATLGAVAEVLATSDHLLRDDLQAFRRRLQQVPPVGEAGVLLRDAAGTVLLAEGRAVPRSRDAAAEAAALETGRPQFSGLLPGADRAAAGFAVIVPVPDSPRAPKPRVLCLLVPLTALARLLAAEDVPETMTASITDGTGRILARTRDAVRLVGTRPQRDQPPPGDEGWRRGVDADGVPVVLAHARSEISGWTAWMLMPETAFSAPLRRSLMATIGLAMLFAALAVGLAVALARRITRPISELAHAVKLGEDRLPETPVREVNALADAHAAARAEAQRLREAQAELRRIARLNEMGTLAAALAHEINQPLTAAAAFAEGALRLLRDGTADARFGEARDAVQAAADQALHAGRIVGRLRAFLAASDGQRAPSDLNALVADATRLALADGQQRGVRLHLALAPDLPTLMLDRVQIGQVVVNLVRNAVEAMAAGPRRELRIVTCRQDPGRVELRVTDTGPGIAPGLRAGLFLPFVTSKPGGMGVGLAIARAIIEDHEGQIDWSSGPDGGTVFRVSLPAGNPPHAG